MDFVDVIKNFKNNKYCYVKNAISKDLCDISVNYTLFDETNNFTPEVVGSQVPGAHSKHGDSLMESMLLYVLPIIEKNTGLKVFPTYSYYRVYRPGASLLPHKDRESCEISASLFLGRNYNGESWKLYIEGSGYSMEPGDMIIYRGTELNHYRYEFEAPEQSYHSQVFLHYVDQNGPYSEYKYDKRVGVGGIKNDW
jgi:hypothetical protein